MAEELQYDVCPETGIGCVMVNKDSGVLKIDLMPDEVSSLEDLVKAGDLAGARALLAGVDSKAESALDDDLLRALAQEVR
jgi:hypothetical protein